MSAAATLGELLARLAPVAPELVAPREWGRIRQLGDDLPASAAEFFGFECRLGAGPLRSDFAMNLAADGIEAAAEGRLFPEDSWSGIRALCRRWAGAGQQDGGAGRIWLEFDIDVDPRESPANVFVCLSDRAPMSGGTLAREAIPMLRGAPLSDPTSACFARTADVARADRRVLQVGLMLSRPIDAVRLCVLGVRANEAVPLLRSVRWSGNLDRVRALVDRYGPCVDHFGLHLDISDDLLPTLGVELLFEAAEWDRQPHREPRWELIFDRMLEQGLAKPEQTRALLAWPGLTDDGLFAVDKALAGPGDLGARGSIMRGLQHIKIGLSPDGRVTAKAYFGAHHLPWETTP